MARVARFLLLLIALSAATAWADSLPDRILEHRARRAPDESPENFPGGIRVLRDIAYGSDPRQRFDVYAPSRARAAPVILMVHGGAWVLGDKGARGVVENKVARWVPRGFIVISANYRLVPQADPLEQARDIARALAAAQGKAADWGGEQGKFILMGHSAGAHLVALLAASPALAAEQGAGPWLGTVLLDSGALDVPQIMNNRHPPFYDRAFGNNPDFWQAVSPYHLLSRAGTPVLAVCSSRRQDACPQARRLAAKAGGLGMGISVLEQNLSHGDVNGRLGELADYTAAVEFFLGGLDPAVARALAAAP